jgi:hypothetical protein
LPEADGVDEVGALVLDVAGAGLVSVELPQAASDSTVAPVTARNAARESREVERVAGIGVLSVVGHRERTDSVNGFTINGAAECTLSPD